MIYIYIKTNYDRNNNYLNLLENDIITYKFLNSSLNEDNNNDINVDNRRNTKNHSVNINKYNKSLNINSNITRNKTNIYNHKNSLTLETKLNSNDMRKKLDEKIKVDKRNRSIKNSKPKLSDQQYNLFTLNNKESNILNNYHEANNNSISNYINENDINLQYMKTDINFTGLRLGNTNNKSYRNNINSKKFDESSKYISTNANTNNCIKYKDSKKKASFKSTFRKEKVNTPQTSVHKGALISTQKQAFVKNHKKNNSIKRVYKNLIENNEFSNNNMPKSKNSIEFRILSKKSKSINNKCKTIKSNTNRVVHNKTNSYSNYIHNACNKKNYISNEGNPLNPKFFNEYKNFKNVLTENAKIPMTINDTPYLYNNSLKQLKYSSNRRNNYNINQKSINNRIITSHNNNKKKQNSKINYNFTSTNLENNKSKNKTNKNSHENLSINKKEKQYTSRLKSQKQGIIKNKNISNNYNYNFCYDNKLINDILSTESCIKTINTNKNPYENNQAEDTNKIIINLNILKQKIIVDNNKNNLRKNKYSSSLIKTYNNIDINTNKKNNLKKNSFTHNIFANIINNENNHTLKNNNQKNKNQKSFN